MIDLFAFESQETMISCEEKLDLEPFSTNPTTNNFLVQKLSANLDFMNDLCTEVGCLCYNLREICLLCYRVINRFESRETLILYHET